MLNNLIKRIFKGKKQGTIEKMNTAIATKETSNSSVDDLLDTLAYIELIYDSKDISRDTNILTFNSLLKKMNYQKAQIIRMKELLKEDNIEYNNLFVVYPTEDNRNINHPTTLIYCLPDTKILVDAPFTARTLAYAVKKLLQREETFDKKFENGLQDMIREIKRRDEYAEFCNEIKVLQKAHDENDFSELVFNLLSERYRMPYVCEDFSDMMDKCSKQELKQLVSYAYDRNEEHFPALVYPIASEYLK